MADHDLFLESIQELVMMIIQQLHQRRYKASLRMLVLAVGGILHQLTSSEQLSG